MPESVPVLVSKLAHDGWPEIAKVNVSPSGSDAVGAKEYWSEIVILDGGVPDIVGAELPTGGGVGVGDAFSGGLSEESRQPTAVAKIAI